MNQDQRLIPFLGGLIVGGVGGSLIDNKNPYNNYPPYYSNYQYPAYNYYPSYQYPQYIDNNQQIITGYNQNESMYSAKIYNEQPIPIMINSNRSIVYDISYVPPYEEKKLKWTLSFYILYLYK